MIKTDLDEKYWDKIFTSFSAAVRAMEKDKTLPSVSIIADSTENDPYAVLVSTILSLRTKDEVTIEASGRLLAVAPDVYALDRAAEEEIRKAIYPCGFYMRKASQLKKIARQIIERFDGRVPRTAEELLSLPGVGIKTANLTLNLGFGIPAICVDCHVHQISNRLGWIDTRTPEESVKALEAIMPEKYWIPLNELLVSFGQKICTSLSPFCSKCPAQSYCPKKGVERHR